MQHIDKLVRRHFDALAQSYDEKANNRSAYLQTADEEIISLVTRTARRRPVILDIGTGTGKRLQGLAARLPDTTLYACDVSPEMVRIARANGLRRVKVATLTDLPYNDEQFDYVFSLFFVFGYLSTEQERTTALREISRVLKPGGMVVIDVINRWHTGDGHGYSKRRRTIVSELIQGRVKHKLEWGDVMFNLDIDASSVPGYFHTFTDKEANKLFRNAGFSIESHKVIGYGSGTTQAKLHQGNFLYVLKKRSEK